MIGLKESYASIGKALNRKDHSTIIHGVKKIEEDLKESPSIKSAVDVLTKKISN